MTVRGIEAIKMYMPPTKAKININVREEKAQSTEIVTDNAATSMSSSVARYRQEWERLLLDLSERPERMRDLAFSGDLKVSKFRSVYWALLLRVLNLDYSGWHMQRKMQRLRYDKLKEEFIKNPHKTNVPENDDPLSQSQQSVWNQYFSDQELFGVIKQDVVRTCPGVDFFRKEIIQTAMCNILFYYAREHPYMSYRQGMHEILAPLLFVIYGDQQSFLHYSEIAKEQPVDEVLANVLDSQYLEADSYSLFSRLMSSIESYYRITNLLPTAGGYLPPVPKTVSNAAASASEVEVIAQLNFIRDKILAKEDSHLHKYLLELDIPLHLFGIRWLRLLFGREFMLVDLMVLWDAIFADSDRFELPNYILVAMLIRIRNKLLMSDFTTCLTHLMRYPPNEDVQLILRHALHMQMPKKFDRPQNAFVYFTPNSDNAAVPTHDHNVSGAAGNSVKMKMPAQNDSIADAANQRMRSTSLSDTAKMVRQISIVQTHNASEAAELAKMDLGADANRIIMDGYSENSPELLRLELKNAQSVITIARGKLQAHLATVRKGLTKVHSADVMQALDGIEELCTFLDVKFMFPLHARSRAPIDQATEANEQKTKLTSPELTGESGAKASAPAAPSDNASSWIAAISGGLTTEFAATGAASSANTAYEKPDVGFMFKSSHLLGNLKEIELLPILTDEKVTPATVINSD